MKNVVKWAGIVLGSLFVILLIALGTVYFLSSKDLDMRYEIEPVAVAIPEPDSAMIERGRHVSEIRGCTGCHGGTGRERLLRDNTHVCIDVAP